MSKAKTAGVMTVIRGLLTRGTRRQAGMTISEVLITISLVGVVGAIALPIVNNIIATTQIDAAKQDLARVGTAIRNSMGVPDPATVNIPTRIVKGQEYTFSEVAKITPAVDQRIVMKGAGTNESPYTSYCVTTYVADQDFQFSYGDKEVSIGSCNLPSGSVLPPTAPLNVVVDPQSATSVSVGFDAPASNGGSPITGYNAVCTSENGGITGYASGLDTVSSLVVGTLTTGKTYTCKVNAENITGPGDWSESSAPAVIYTTPGEPTGVDVERRWTGAVVVSFTSPVDNGGSVITAYDTTCKSSNGGADATQTGDKSPMTLTGLTMGKDYTCSVTATNAAGTGSASVASTPFLAAQKPEAPTATSVTVASLSSVNVAFDPSGVEAGEPTTGYEATCELAFSNQTHTGTGSSSPILVSGLSAGSRYSCTVTATNVLGTSDNSNAIATEVANSPDAPGDVTADRGAGDAADEITVSWSTPASNGSDITAYEVVAVPTAGNTVTKTVASTVNSTTLSGLMAGQTYTLKVRATNEVGNSLWSEAGSTYTAPSKPGTVSGVNVTANPSTASSTTTSVDVDWTAPASNGDAIVTYVVEYKKASVNVWSTFTHADSDNTSITVTGLQKGIAYDFRVAAVNTVDQGDWSSEATGTTYTSAPSAPRNLSVVANTPTASAPKASAYLTWSAPLDNGGSDSLTYTIEYKKTSDTAWTVFSNTETGTTATVSGLDKATGYDFRVSVSNATGASTESNTDSVTTGGTAPAKPSGLNATANAIDSGTRLASASLSWTAPNNGGADITDYIVQYKATSATEWVTFEDGVSTTASATVTGLQPGSAYEFRVAAINSLGTSGYSNEDEVFTPLDISPVAPTAPTGLVLTPGAASTGSATTSISLTWAAPADNGGAAILDYIIEYKPTNGFTWTVLADGLGTGTSAAITGLDKGTSYDVRVKAVNSADAGATVEGSATTQATAPSKVTGLTVAANAGTPIVTTVSTYLAWEVPADLGGSAVTDYVVQYKASSSQTWITFADGVSTALNATVTGLSKGTSYDFQVAAKNSTATGAYSDTVAKTTTVTAPCTITLMNPSMDSTTATLPWVECADNGGAALTGYAVKYRAVGVTLWSVFESTLATSSTITGLQKGVSYEFQVDAGNSVGVTSSEVKTGTTLTTAPAVPATLTAAAQPVSAGSSASVNLTWTPPTDNGGSAVTGYNVYSAGSFVTTVSAATRNYMVNSLTKGVSYTFEVAAVNAIGEGTKKSVARTTNTSVPSAPTSLSLTPSSSVGSLTSGSIAASWSAPSDLGGSGMSISGYDVYLDGTFVGSTTASNRTWNFTGLTKGVSYTVAVYAGNSNGSSAGASGSATPPVTAPSATSLSITGAALNTTAIAGYNSAYFSGGSPATWAIAVSSTYKTPAGTFDTSWTAPSDSGGSGQTVTYTLTVDGVAKASGTSALSLANIADSTMQSGNSVVINACNTAGLCSSASATRAAINAPPASVTLSAAYPLNWSYTSAGLSPSGAGVYRFSGSSTCSAAHMSSERMGFSTAPANNNWTMSKGTYTTPYFRVLFEWGGSTIGPASSCRS